MCPPDRFFGASVALTGAECYHRARRQREFGCQGSFVQSGQGIGIPRFVRKSLSHC